MLIATCLSLGVIVVSIVLAALYLFNLKKDLSLAKEDISILKKKYQKNKGDKNLKIIRSSINTLFAIFVICLAGFIFATSGIIDSKYQILAVSSDSMSYKNNDNNYLENLDDQFNKGDLIGIEKVASFSDINLYDIICYKLDNQLIIHRVIDNSSGNYFITKGDANSSADPIRVSFKQVVGKYSHFRIKGLGYPVLFLKSEQGVFVAVSLIGILIVYLVADSYKSKLENKRLEFILNDVKDKSNFSLTIDETHFEIKDGKIVFSNSEKTSSNRKEQKKND